MRLELGAVVHGGELAGGDGVADLDVDHFGVSAGVGGGEEAAGVRGRVCGMKQMLPSQPPRAGLYTPSARVVT